MAARLVRPEMLFLLGTLQALFPYVLWGANGTALNYDSRVTFLPTQIYAVGYLCFFLGTRFARPGRQAGTFAYVGSVDLGRLFRVRAFVLALAVYAIVDVLRVYGAIPLAAFLAGQADINDARIWGEGTWLGQLAFLQMALSALTAVLLIDIVVSVRAGTIRILSWPVAIPLLTIAFGFTMGGKRQGLVMSLVFLVAGLALYSPRSIELILNRFLMRGKLGRALGFLAASLAVVTYFEYMGKVRIEEDFAFGVSDSVRYMELPLINLEYQCERAGYGPGDFAPAALLQTLLPKRLELIFPKGLFDYEPAPRLEPTSPTGFYGDLHWYTGMPGICLFAFFTGWVCKYVFYRAASSPFAFFCYCQFAWPLLSCCMYNHFSNLVYVPLPILVYGLLVVCLFGPGRPRGETLAPMAAIQPHLQFQSGRARPMGRPAGIVRAGWSQRP